MNNSASNEVTGASSSQKKSRSGHSGRDAPVTVFDIGMFDGSDTAYYLETGCRVIAVEANPPLVKSAEERFRSQLASGQLTCVQAAISSDNKEVELFLSAADPGSSSLFSERVANKRPDGAIRVRGMTLDHLFDEYGIPDYLKVDIEGADRLCVLALTQARRPHYLSFEIGDDVEELVHHIESIGFNRFTIINQKSFREIGNENPLYDRFARRSMRYLGFARPRLIRRGKRFFAIGHSSGPAPWESDGRWSNAVAIRGWLRKIASEPDSSNWYDLHARTD
ncbi:MAG TPA: FkbM family methyltransferase [Gemmatimonadaceae bacterium]